MYNSCGQYNHINVMYYDMEVTCFRNRCLCDITFLDQYWMYTIFTDRIYLWPIFKVVNTDTTSIIYLELLQLFHIPSEILKIIVYTQGSSWHFTLHTLFLRKVYFICKKRNLKRDGILKQSKRYFEMFECKDVYSIRITFMFYTHGISS